MYMETKESEAVPRAFYQPMVLLGEAFSDCGVDEDAVEEALDSIETIIVETLQQTEGDSDEEPQGDEPSE
jgi:hypothetical protein